MALIQPSSDNNDASLSRRQLSPALADQFKAIALNHCVDALDRMFDNADHLLEQCEEREPFDFDAPAGLSTQAVMTAIHAERTLISRCFIEEFGHAISFGSTSDGSSLPLGEIPEGLLEEPFDASGGQSLQRRIAGMARKADFRHCELLNECQQRLDPALEDGSARLDPSGLAPANACNALRLALMAANLDEQVEAQVFRLFDDQVLARLGECYTALNDFLEQEGFAATADAAARLRRRPRPAAADPAAPTPSALGNSAINPPNESEKRCEHDAVVDHETVGEQKVRQYLEGLLAELTDSPDMSAITRSQLGRLLPSATNCVQGDTGLLSDIDHPVRRLFSEIALIDLLDSEQIQDAQKVASHLIEQLGATPNLTQIAEAVRDLETSLAAHNGSQEAPARAARRTMLELNQQATGLGLSRNAHVFLADCWFPLLQEQARKGPTSEDFLSVRNHGRSLIHTVHLLDTNDPRAADEREEMFKATRRKLKLLKIETARFDAIMARLDTLLGRHARAEAELQPYCPEEAELLDELAGWSPVASDGTQEEDDEAPDSRLDDETLEMLGELCKPGVWFRIYAGPKNSARWRKLSHYDREGQRIIFGDRNGENRLEISAAEFAADLAAERSRPVYDSDEFSRTLTSIIHRQSRTLD